MRIILLTKYFPLVILSEAKNLTGFTRVKILRAFALPLGRTRRTTCVPPARVRPLRMTKQKSATTCDAFKNGTGSEAPHPLESLYSLIPNATGYHKYHNS